MFNVINQLKENITPSCVDELMFNGLPPQEEVDQGNQGSIEEHVPDHLILEQHYADGDVLAVLLLCSLHFALPGMLVSCVDCSYYELVDRFIASGGTYVIHCPNRFVVAGDVVVKEMGVEELGEGPSSNGFVEWFSLVNQFMAANGTDSGEEAPLECECDVSESGADVRVEPRQINVNPITADNERPQPSEGLQADKGNQRDVKPVILQELPLALLRQVALVRVLYVFKAEIRYRE